MSIEIRTTKSWTQTYTTDSSIIGTICAPTLPNSLISFPITNIHSLSRIAPVSMYDWLVIVTTLLYIIYFIDIVGRAAGWKCLGRKNKNRTEIEMEAPSNIQPGKFRNF